MNYIKEINAFYDWLELNSVRPSVVILWHALMHLNNKAGWVPEFTVARSVIEAKTGLKKDAYYTARNQLRQLGRIEFKERGTKATAFRIIPLSSEKQTTSPTTNQTITPTTCQTINKLNKTKQNKEDEGADFVDRILDLLQKSEILKKEDITEFLREDISDVIDHFGFDHPEEMILEAIKDSARGNGRTWKYVYKKLVDWRKKGIKTVADLENMTDGGETHGAKIHQYRRSHGRPAKESPDPITGGQVGWLGRKNSV